MGRPPPFARSGPRHRGGERASERLCAQEQLCPSGIDFKGMKLSPDGRRLAFIYYGDNGEPALRVMGAFGGRPRELLSWSSEAEDYVVLWDWAPDGILYTRGQAPDRTLWIISPEGGAPWPIELEVKGIPPRTSGSLRMEAASPSGTTPEVRRSGSWRTSWPISEPRDRQQSAFPNKSPPRLVPSLPVWSKYSNVPPLSSFGAALQTAFSHRLREG